MDNFYLEVIESFNIHQVAYLVIGGFAVNFYGYNRSTGDLDLWVSKDQDNLKKLENALEKLGFEFGSEAKQELTNDRMVVFSKEETVIELITKLNISKTVSFEEAYGRADLRKVRAIDFRIISLEDLKNEKSQSKRYKDLNDLSMLEEAEIYYTKKSKEE